MSLRYIKILLSLSVGVWGIIAGSMNLVYYDYGAVGAVMTLEGQESLRSISNEFVHNIGYAFIYIGKFATGIFCLLGTIDLWKFRNESTQAFNSAKSKTLTGCGIALFFLFFGFIVVAGSYFNPGFPTELGRSYHQYTLFYIGSIGIIAMFISSVEPSLE